MSVGTQVCMRRLELVENHALPERGVELLRTTGSLRAVETNYLVALAVIKLTRLDVWCK